MEDRSRAIVGCHLPALAVLVTVVVDVFFSQQIGFVHSLEPLGSQPNHLDLMINVCDDPVLLISDSG
jgi:hypothetical protein